MRIKNKSFDKVITNILILYFIFIFFYGIIIKITFPYKFLFTIKTIIPESLLFTICLLCVFKTKKISKISFLAIIYFFMVLVLNLFTSYSTNSFMMTFRDVFIPIITGFLLSSISMSEESYYDFFKKITIVSVLAIIIGFILGILQYSRGWEWTSAWYTGYSFWGNDEVASMYIMTSGKHVRVPSVVGHNVKFAMATFFQILCVMSYFRVKIKNNKNRKLIYNLIEKVSVLLGMINIFISNNKTTFVICIILFVICLIKHSNRYSKIIITFTSLVLGLYIYFELKASTDFLLSFFDRFSKWSLLFKQDIIGNLILPISTFNFAGNSDTTVAVLNYWDNTYLYFIFAFGLLGLYLLLYWLYAMSIGAHKICYSKGKMDFIYYLALFTILSSFTTSIVLGRSFFNIYILTVAFLSNKKGRLLE